MARVWKLDVLIAVTGVLAKINGFLGTEGAWPLLWVNLGFR